MKTALLLRHLLPAVLFLSFMVHAETGFSRTPVSPLRVSGLSAENGPSAESGGPVVANVPLNEINVRAYRFFHKEWSAISEEVWYRTDKEFIVSFSTNSHRKRAFFNLRGIFLYSLEYYAGNDLAADLAVLIQNKYPGYQIKVVTEVSNLERTTYFINIENSSSIKTLSVVNGKMEVYEELINGDGGANLAQN